VAACRGRTAGDGLADTIGVAATTEFALPGLLIPGALLRPPGPGRTGTVFDCTATATLGVALAKGTVADGVGLIAAVLVALPMGTDGRSVVVAGVGLGSVAMPER